MTRRWRIWRFNGAEIGFWPERSETFVVEHCYRRIRKILRPIVMKNLIVYPMALALALSWSANAAIITGPITNPANGHEYYLLSANSWTASEAEAERIGGTLAVIRNVGEQEWVTATFTAYGQTNRNLWIGLHRSYHGGPWAWVTDAPVNYSNWERGQPDNNGGNESYVHMFCRLENRIPGTWNDLADATSMDGAPICGVVEVPGKAKEKALNSTEKALVGKWYYAGKENDACRIAGTDNELFVINESNLAGRAVMTPEGNLFIAPWHLYGEVVKDKILWSNGTWWSRRPSEYDSAAGQVKVEGLDRSAGREIDNPVLQ
jgi:Lectin C-type domain